MDETNVNGKSRRARVLRASDVIPPFDKNVAQAKGVAADTEPIGSASAKPSPGRGVTLLKEAPVEVPTYDLAENLLAGQRRIASRRRRAPGHGEEEPVVRLGQVRPRNVTADRSPEDLLALRQIVAEIVARDIERLRRGPN